MPAGLEPEDNKELPIPMAVETFVTSLGIDLTEDQRTHNFMGSSKDLRQMTRKSTSAGRPKPPTPPGPQCG